ncbi:MAG: SpoIVB peptidase [Ruminococcaceae bacterium]|nr:SpoIVB peptidase [Oscillospiraceae bacterium]
MMQKAKTSKIFRSIILSIAVLLLFGTSAGLAVYSIPNDISVLSGTDANNNLGFLSSVIKLDDIGIPVSGSEEGSYCIGNTVSTAKIFGIIPIKTTNIKVYKNIKLYPGGMPFGIKLKNDYVIINAINDVMTENGAKCPARDAGLKVGDAILKINGKKINAVSDVSDIIGSEENHTVTFEVQRGEDLMYIKVVPIRAEDGKSRTGISVKDSTAGIGTVTYIDPSDNSFAGLGHGICDQTTGEPVPFKKGDIMEVNINGISKGKIGTPGEIKGYFTSKRLGSLSKNIGSGVYGTLDELPHGISSEPLPIGLKSEVKEGPATIYCTLDNGNLKEYDIEISKINNDSNTFKNFLITVKDPSLLELTGGIVQGMSGSPILQNGRIVGAVTHVLINDPTKGYGIFIENMLEAAR